MINFGHKKKYKYTVTLDPATDEKLKKSLIELQNEIASSYGTNTISVVPIDDDDNAILFAHALAKTYILEGLKTLVVDANLYREEKHTDCEQPVDNSKGYVTFEKDSVEYCVLDKHVYPSEYFKDNKFAEILKVFNKQYSHVIVVMPQLKKHKELNLVKNLLDCSIFVCKKNKTKKEDLFYSIEFAHDNDIKLAKVIVLK